MHDRHIERWRRLKAVKSASVVFAGALVVVCAVALAVSRMAGTGEELPNISSNPDERLRVRNFAYSSPGAHPWELTALSAAASEGLDKVKVEAPRVVYFGADGRDVTLTARLGEVDRKTGNVLAEGDVTVGYGDFTFKTSHLKFNQKEGAASTTSAVSLRGDSLLLTGKSMKLTLEPQQVVVEEDVEAKLYNVKWTEPGRKLPL
jgi:LPS export ABC transporter protein LptC